MKYAKERKTTSILRRIIAVFVIIISLAIQIAISYFLITGIYIFKNAFWFDVANIIVTITSFIVVAHIYNRNINTSYKLTWSILILLLPWFGLFMYLFYGNGHYVPKRKSRIIKEYLANREQESEKVTKDDVDVEGYNIIKGLEKMSQLICYKNTDVIFYNDALKKHQQMVEDLKNAKKYIFMEFFVLAKGKLLDEIYEILSSKSKEGVRIYIIYDDVGSGPTFPRKEKNRFKQIENLTMHPYAPYGKNLNPGINYRDHRKIVVIDGIYAYCGGDNLADEYIHEKVRFGYWRDNAIRIEGDAVEGFIKMFLEMWYLSSKEMLSFNDFKVSKHNIDNNNIVMPFGDGPTYLSHPSYSLFINLIASAKKSIYISTPYFIIDKEFINALCRALINGVEVIILTPSIPDKKSVFYLTRENYKDIIALGGKVYEYLPGFNHAKNIIIDDKYAFIGTVNIDYRSFFLHFECGTLLMHNEVIKEMKENFEYTLCQSQLITMDIWNQRPYYQRFIAFLLYFISPLF